jgi:hypothetical protein
VNVDSTGFSEHGNQPSVSVNDGEFFDWLRDKGLLKKDPASYGRYSIVRENRGHKTALPD